MVGAVILLKQHYCTYNPCFAQQPTPGKISSGFFSQLQYMVSRYLFVRVTMNKLHILLHKIFILSNAFLVALL